MKKIFIGGGAVVLVALLAAGVFVWQRTDHASDLSSKTAGDAINADQAWIEITADHAYRASSENAASSTELFSGDQIAVGDVIFTDATGGATIHFPDGSLARIDAKTKLVLNESRFSSDTGSMGVRIMLFAGSVWSKIIQLATPDSQWQVQTSNTVATVRGTAFGVSYTSGISQIIGSEHTVLVAPIDPVTHAVLEDRSAPLSQGRMMRVSDDRISEIVKKRADLSTLIATTSPALLEQPWVRAAQKSDAVIDATVQRLEQQRLDMRAIRKTLREENIKLRQEQLLRRQPASPALAPLPNGGSASTLPELATTTQAPGAGAVSVVRVTVKSDTASTTIGEGQRIVFTAEAILSDGTRKNVTDAAEWKVLGDIGAMTVPGVFIAQLGATTAEYGQGTGNVVAIFKDPASSQFILGKSILYTVQTNIVPQINPLQG